MAEPLPSPMTIPPAPSHPHTHTILFLHGRGDTASDFAQSLQQLHSTSSQTLISAFPTIRFVFPQAPLRELSSAPGTIWPQWFDVCNTSNFAEREEVQTPGLQQSVSAIRQLLAAEATLLSDRWDRIVLAGISMGAATGVHTLFNLNVPDASTEGVQGRRLGAFMGFSARCPFVGRDLADMRDVLGLDGVPDHADVLEGTPVMLQHCVDDPLVLVQNGRGLRDTLRKFGAQVEWKEYERGGHWFREPEGIDDAIDFIRRCVVDRFDGAARNKSAVENAMDLS